MTAGGKERPIRIQRKRSKGWRLQNACWCHLDQRVTSGEWSVVVRLKHDTGLKPGDTVRVG